MGAAPEARRAPEAPGATALAHPAVAALARALDARPGARARVAAEHPALRRAAVALVLRVGADAGGGLEVLLVKRAEYPGDPWSGHVAFPGGRREPGDPDLWHTAARETREETGLDLLGAGHPLGTLDELHPRTPVLPPIVVRPYVAVTTAAPGDDALVLSDELAGAFWVPLAHFAMPGVSAERVVEVHGAQRTVSSYGWAGHTVWGLTERILRQFVGLAVAAGAVPAGAVPVGAVTVDTEIVRG